MKTSESILKIAPKLLEAQKSIGVIIKDAKNPFFDSTYADLKAVINAVKTPLNNVGISYLQAVGTAESGMAMVETILLHESGEFISTETPVLCKKPNDPQAMGSGITYAKRYALQAIMGLPTKDDDGNAATRETATKPEPAKPDVDINWLKGEAVVKWMQTDPAFHDADDVIKYFAREKTVTNECHAFITELFGAQGT